MLNKYLKWIALAFTVVGAVLTALKLYPENMMFFNVGSILWMIWAWRIREWSLVAVNSLLFGIYVGGIVYNA